MDEDLNEPASGELLLNFAFFQPGKLLLCVMTSKGWASHVLAFERNLWLTLLKWEREEREKEGKRIR